VTREDLILISRMPLGANRCTSGTKQECEFDPWIFSGGLGYRFILFRARAREPAAIALK
jgi:hypothetical protein